MWTQILAAGAVLATTVWRLAANAVDRPSTPNNCGSTQADDHRQDSSER